MNQLLKPIVAAGLMGLGLLSTQAQATYATFVTSGSNCSNPCGTTVKPMKHTQANYTRVVTTTVITSTVVSRPRTTTRHIKARPSSYCPPPRHYVRKAAGGPPRDGRAYYREPGFIW